MGTRQRVGTAITAVLATSLVVIDAGAAGAGKRAPRVEDLAVAAVVNLGDDAPAAVVHELGAGRSLRRIVRAIEADTLPVPEDPADDSSTTTTVPATAADGNPVVAVDEGGIEPSRSTIDPTAPLIVANRGTKVHIVEIKGTDQPKTSLEPSLVAVYELDGLAPGRYTLRCIVAGHEERAVLTIPGAPSAGLRSSFAAVPASVDDRVRAPGDLITDILSTDDALGRAVMFAGIVAEMHRGGDAALEEAERLREQAAREQAELDTKAKEPTTADARRVVARAEDEDADPEMALLTTAILLAARNGYDAGQITEFILDESLAPEVWETGQGPIRLRDVFLAGGIIPGVVPKNAPVDDVLRADEAAAKPEGEQRDDEGADDSAVTGRFRGEFTGRMLEQYRQVSYPGGPPPLENRVDVTITDGGRMKFDLALVMKSSWITRDDVVVCGGRYSLFSSVTPRPTAKLADDGTFESSPFNASSRVTDLAGPECGSHPYQGDNDEEFTGVVIAGSVDGDTIRGSISIEAEGERGEIEFRASRR